MKLFRFLPLVTLLSALADASAATVVVVQGNHSPFGRRYLSGFSSLATEKVKAFQYEGKKEKSLLVEVKKIVPDLVLTIGEVPLGQLVTLLPSTPFIVGDYYATGLARRANIVMLESDLPIGTGINLVQSLFPARKTIGTIYDPKYSQAAVDALFAFTAKLGLKVASIKVDTPNDVASYIQAFAGKIDLFYCMRDPTTSNETAASQIFTFADKNNIPVVSLDPSHIERGALLTVAIDPLELGEQAWNVASIILKEGKIPQMPVTVDPRELTASISMKAAARFGIGAEALFGFLQKGVKEGYSVRVEP